MLFFKYQLSKGNIVYFFCFIQIKFISDQNYRMIRFIYYFINTAN